jgi:hypothetical protein
LTVRFEDFLNLYCQFYYSPNTTNINPLACINTYGIHRFDFWIYPIFVSHTSIQKVGSL